MRITVKLFAIVRERAGQSELSMEFADAATVAIAAEKLAGQFPQIAQFLSRAAFAVNQNYASRETLLQDGDELAVIPPVSGG